MRPQTCDGFTKRGTRKGRRCGGDVADGTETIQTTNRELQLQKGPSTKFTEEKHNYTILPFSQLLTKMGQARTKGSLKAGIDSDGAGSNETMAEPGQTQWGCYWGALIAK